MADYLITYEPIDLKLRFSTSRNLFEIQERSDGAGPALVITLCNDKSAHFVSVRRVFTNNGWKVDTQYYGERGDPAQPEIHPDSDGRYIYQAPVRLTTLFTPLRDSFGLGWQRTELPNETIRSQEFCIGLRPYGPRGKGAIHLPRDIVSRALDLPPPASP